MAVKLTNFEEIVNRLRKIVSTKSKFKYREEKDFSRALILKTLDCSFLIQIKYFLCR